MARERQRTMDADMALHLSRARSIGMASPTAGRVLDDNLNFPSLSPQEEEDVSVAQGLRHERESTATLNVTPPEPALATPQQPPPVLSGVPMSASLRLAHSAFDFGPLDTYAAHERARMAPASAPVAPGDLRARLAAVTSPVLDEAGALHVRRGKLALFEGVAGAPPPTLPQPGFPARRAASIFEEPYRMEQHEQRYRFSFYSNAVGTAIHAKTLADLPGPSQTFADLFRGVGKEPDERDRSGAATPSDPGRNGKTASFTTTNAASNAASTTLQHEDDEQSTWWLDVLCPTEEEMRLLSKVFGIHPLTTEDILTEETREKIELFRNYYLVCFRSFDQDPYSPTHLEPLNMYIVVFREGTLSFHFQSTNHPQNVRRRIKQLRDYINVTSDWISYALIDDITDAFGPLIQSIEYEVDNIDELVLILSPNDRSDMLRRIGTCRKKVMGLLRLMGNKADVVKGLAKRCNENWSVAPKSDIGLYLSDIQDHLITMTQNLNHYEKILSRSHSNYLAQISIEMTDANNQINDVLSKLTALGTVLVPMNLITGLWGMNVHVPGQDVPNFRWFGGIIGVLVAFALTGSYLAYKLMRRPRP